MLETKDSAIKLFGKTIPISEIHVGKTISESIDDHHHDFSTNSSNESHNNKDASQEHEIEKNTTGEKLSNKKNEDGFLAQSTEEFTNPDATSRTDEESVTVSTEREVATLKTSKTEEEQDETSNTQDKHLKKPDKIVPCPRCSSMDTKFCYYNNYNVNQPRHFCKNCQRYWTAGGTMRNVPVGAGRRKNKSSSEATLQNSRIHPSLKCNGTILTFGSNSPLCDSVASVLKLADKTVQNYTRNGYHKHEELRICVPHTSEEQGEDQSNKSSVTSTKSTEGATTNVSQEQAMWNGHSFPPQGGYFPHGTPWHLPWNPMQTSSLIPPPAFCPSGFSMPFYPATYWGCTMPSAWNIPRQAQPSSPNGANHNSTTNSPTLGKHSREENMLKSSEGDGKKEISEEKSLWFPKTLRIDDSEEAEKSSFWTTLGIKNNNADSVPPRRLFQAFPSKCDEKNHSVQVSSVLQANPAALSRSLHFHETS